MLIRNVCEFKQLFYNPSKDGLRGTLSLNNIRVILGKYTNLNFYTFSTINYLSNFRDFEKNFQNFNACKKRNFEYKIFLIFLCLIKKNV